MAIQDLECPRAKLHVAIFLRFGAIFISPHHACLAHQLPLGRRIRYE